MNKRLLVVFILGFSSGVPFALISSTLQAWFSSTGMPLTMTGLLSLLSFPYVYRMLWAPLVDRFSLSSIGRRRSWILWMQILLFVGFNILAWCSPPTHPYFMMMVALVLAFLSATQDIAIDAHRTEYLLCNEHALGASVAIFGYRLALLVAGGVMLIVAQHVGWEWTYRLSGCLMIPGIWVIMKSREPDVKRSGTSTFKATFITPFLDLLVRDKAMSLFIFIFLFKLGEAFTTTTSGIVMPFLIQGIGFSLDTIAYVNKILGLIAIVLGGFSAGVLLLRWSLYRALFVFGLLQALTNLLFVALAIVGKNIILLSAAVISDNFVGGMGATALVALIMGIVNKEYTGTQFSILIACSTLPRVLSGPIAALLQSWFGWVGLYEVSVIFAVLFVPFLLRIKSLIPPLEIN